MKVFRKIIAAVLIVLLVAVLLLAGIRIFVILKARKNIAGDAAEWTARETGQCDAIVVLGAGVWANRQPSPMLRNRLDRALELYKAGAADKIIVTGDHRPGEYDEVDVMWEYLVVKNVPEERIVRDYKGFSTYESMYRMARVYELKSAVVVTQKYHLYRAMYIGETYGIDVSGVIAENAGSTSGKAYRELREWLATVKDLAWCLFRKEIAL